MTDRTRYVPGPARGAQVRKDGENWTLVLVRELRHAICKVPARRTDTGLEWPRRGRSSRPTSVSLLSVSFFGLIVFFIAGLLGWCGLVLAFRAGLHIASGSRGFKYRSGRMSRHESLG